MQPFFKLRVENVTLVLRMYLELSSFVMLSVRRKRFFFVFATTGLAGRVFFLTELVQSVVGGFCSPYLLHESALCQVVRLLRVLLGGFLIVVLHRRRIYIL